MAAVDFSTVTSGFYEEELEVQNVSDGRVSLDYGEYQVRHVRLRTACKIRLALTLRSKQRSMQRSPCSGSPSPLPTTQANRMTADERAFFEEHGYVIVHDALPEADHAALLASLHTLRDEKIAEGRHPAEQLRQPVFSPTHGLAKQKVIHDLVCPAKIFPKVVDILGINLFLYHGVRTQAVPTTT